MVGLRCLASLPKAEEGSLAPWPLEVLEVVLDYAPRSTLATCARINSTWHDASVKSLYEHYDLFPPSRSGRCLPARFTARQISYLKRTRHLTVWRHNPRLCHAESAPPLPSLRTLSVHSDKIHEGERPFGRRRCPLLRNLNPSRVVFHGPDFPISVTEVWELVGGRDIAVAHDPTKDVVHFHLIDRWPTIINPDGVPRSLTVVFVRAKDNYSPDEVLRYTNLRRLSSWVAMLPSDRPVTIVDIGAGARQQLMPWPLATAWEGGRLGYIACVKEQFLTDVKEAIEAEAGVEGGPGVGAGVEGGIRPVDIEARLANIHFVEMEDFIATPGARDVFAK